MDSDCIKARGLWLWIPGSCFARPGMTVCLAFLCIVSSQAFALALDFPALSGRVVDQAGVMTAASKSDVEAKSKALEDKSGIQLVVATVKSLQGSDIETYANQLFRFWKLGEAKKNNGVLLLVAPAEHKVRIEVGYGLEGTLTDALSSVIIASAILPRFKSNDFSGGIERGVDGIVDVLSGDTAGWQPKVSLRSNDDLGLALVVVWCAFVIIAIIVVGYLGTRSGRYVTRGGDRVFVPTASSSNSSSWGGSSSSGSSSSSDSGFSGGGGSSGGGGASGSW
jgi:uncharacterized protein